MVFIILFATVMSVYVGIGIARYCVAIMFAKSNNIGDSKGSLFHFSKGSWDMKVKTDLGSSYQLK